MRMNLNFLSAFLAVAEHGNFHRAAKEVFRSQSAVSMQIKQLEDDLGIPLFRRTTRKVSLTDEGEHLVLAARNALDELAAAVGTIQKSAAARKNLFEIACVPTFAASYLPPIITRFQSTNPCVTVFVHEMATTALLEGVRKLNVEIGIGPRVDEAPDLEFEFIAYNELCALLPKRFASPGRTEITLEELASMPILMQRGPLSIRNSTLRAFEDRGVMMRLTHEVQQPQTAIAMAAEGIGVAILPRSSLPPALSKRLQVVRIPDLATILETSIISLRGRPLSPTARDFKALIHETGLCGAVLRDAAEQSTPENRLLGSLARRRRELRFETDAG